MPGAVLRGGRITPPPARAKIWLALTTVAIVSGVLAAALVLRTTRPRVAERPTASAEEDRRPVPPGPISDRKAEAHVAVPAEETVSAEPADAPPVAPTQARRRAASAVSGSGRLQIDFEHPLKSGTLKVWVDDALVLDQALASRAKKIVAVTVRKGTVREVLSVPAGAHDIRVEVAWDDQRKAGVLFATIEAEETRTLEIRMPPVLKTLMIKWK